MNRPSNSGAADSIQLLPDEVPELTLDPRNGILPSPALNWGSLILTNHRIIRLSADAQKSVSTMLPLTKITGVEIVDTAKPILRLLQGLGTFAIGMILAVVSWNILNVGLISLLVGGIPLIISIYILAGYFFPEYESELVVSTAGSAIKHPLVTAKAKADSLKAIDRLWLLIYGGQTGGPRTKSARPTTPRPRRLGNASARSSSSTRTPRRIRNTPTE